ncbi:MAG TPA: dihydrofolate reductase family protein [Puia sp.]|nr:dihydrofolate reductase family protein [Puia sp.]
MRKLLVFNFVTLNGYFKGPNGDLSWNRQGGAEESEFAAENAQSGNVLLFGRVTYEHMAGFWPTPQALKHAPALAEGMNKAEKIVFSRTLKKAEWNNTRLVKDNIVEAVRKFKQEKGNDMVILGSGSIVNQFAEEGLIDEYQFMVNPVALGDGTPLFKGIRQSLNLKLVNTRTFKSGVILLSYQPAPDTPAPDFAHR